MIIDLHSGGAPAFTDKPVGAREVEDEELTTLGFYAAFNRWIQRHWIRHLSGAEGAVMAFVFDRTVGWGKRWERIPLRHFVDGFKHDNPVCANDGTGFSMPCVHAAIRSLQKKGAVLVQSAGPKQASKFAVNFNWSPNSRVALFTDMHELKLPKHRQQIRPQGGESMQDSCIDYAKNLHTKRKKGNGSNLFPSETGSPDTRRTAEEIVSEVVRATSSKRTSLLASAKHTPLSLEIAWRKAWASAFPDSPASAWKVREGHAVSAWAKRFGKTNSTPFPELLRWVVMRWRLLMANEFRTMKNAPEFPVPGFAVKFSDRFESAFLRRAELERRATSTAKEEAIARAQDSGMDAETAKRDAEQRLGITEQVEALRKERVRLASQQQTIAVISPVILRQQATAGLKSTSKRPSLSTLLADANQDEEFNPYDDEQP